MLHHLTGLRLLLFLSFALFLLTIVNDTLSKVTPEAH